MEAIFSTQELNHLQSKLWWVACNQSPFLIKSSIYQTTILLLITDLRAMWASRIDKKTLLQQKQIYARTLQVNDFQELLHLFEGILSNPDKKALYQFIRKKNSILTFKVQKQISVYPFSWKFDLLQVHANIMEIVCKEILNPMAKTLCAQEKRSNILKKKLQNVQNKLLSKMGQVQKNYYKSAANEEQQDLKLLVPEPKEHEFLTDLRLEGTSKLFFETWLSFEKSGKSWEKEVEKVKKVEKKIDYVESGLQLLNEIEMKKKQQVQKKKKKNIDFL